MRLPAARFGQSLAPVLILLVVVSVCFHRLITAPSSLVVNGERPSLDHAERARPREVGNDLTTVFLPRFSYVVGQVRANGKWPRWDTSGFGGRPLLGNPQAGLFYPPVWVAYRAGLPCALGWLTVGHLLWGGLGVVVLARSLGLGRPASALTGGCFEASPYLIAHTFEGHYPHVWSACWYPWAFWAWNSARREKWLGKWALPVVLALTFLTGHPQEWYYLVLAITVWVAVVAVREFRAGERAEGCRQVLLWGGLVAVSLGLSATELLPELHVWPWLVTRSVIPLEQVNRYHLHSVNLWQLLHPFALGRPETYAGQDNYWETVFSIGLAPLVMLVIGLTRCPVPKALRGWGWLVLVAVVFAAGRRLGLYTLAYSLIPGMERFRVPARTLFLAGLGASLLAGAGFEKLALGSFSERHWRALRVRVIGSLVLVGSTVVVLSSIGYPQSTTTARGIQAATSIASQGGFWIGVLGVVGVVTLAGRHRRGQVLAAWGLGAVALVELSFTAQSLLVCSPADRFVRRDGVGESLRREKDEWSGPVRVASLAADFPDLRAAGFGLEKTNINDGFQIQHAADLYEALYPFLDSRDGPRPRLRPIDPADAKTRESVARKVLDLMNVRYVVAGVKPPLPGLVRTDSAKPFAKGPVIWRNPTAMPRAYVVPRAAVGDEGRKPLAATLAALDPREAVLMNRDPLIGPDRQPFTPAEWVSHDPDVVTVRVETSAPGLLLVGNTWMPGWEAAVDGRPATVFRGNHWQQVVALPTAGKHEVVLTYEPPGMFTGAAVTLATLAGWGGFGLVLLTRPLRLLEWRHDPRPRRVAALMS